MKKLFTNLKVALTLLLLCGVCNVWADEVTSTFKACTPYKNGMTLPTEDGLSWVTTSAPTAFESASPSRGLSWSKISTDVTASITSATITKVVVVASTNGTANINEIAVTIGGESLSSSQSMGKTNNTTYTFEGKSLTGEIKVSLTSGGDTGKSIWIKSITVTYSTKATETYTISFNGNGATGTMQQQEFKENVASALNTCTFTRDGYAFIGWAESADGDVAYTDGETVTFNTSKTLYAKWAETFAITSVTGLVNGSITTDANRAYAGQTVTIIPTPVEGYKVSAYTITKTENGENITSSVNLNDNTFVMPAFAVTISATFEVKQEEELAFDFTTQIDGWKQSKSESAAGDYTYTLDGTDYIFTLSDEGDGVYQSTYQENTYLMTCSGNTVGLPAIPGYKLSKVVIANTSSCSQATVVSITDGENAINGGEGQTWATQNITYTYELSGTKVNTRYYISAATKNAQVKTLTLTYEKGKSQDVTITNVGYATAYIPFASTVTGATAYYVTIGDDNMAELNEIEGTIPANTGVILKGSEGTVTFTESAEEPASVDGNRLVGTSNEGGKYFKDDTNKYYIFANDENGLGFYRKITESGTLCGQYKALLEVPAESSAKAFFLFDETVGIENVNATKVENPVMYNLAGQRVTNAKGIVIINGKKVLK